MRRLLVNEIKVIIFFNLAKQKYFPIYLAIRNLNSIFAKDNCRKGCEAASDSILNVKPWADCFQDHLPFLF